MKHHYFSHDTGKVGPCEKCSKRILVGHHYFSVRRGRGTILQRRTVFYHEGCLLDAHGDPLPCPDKDVVLRLRDRSRYSTPLFPVRPLEVMEKKQDGNNQRD